jgi:hypothetical protein
MIKPPNSSKIINISKSYIWLLNFAHIGSSVNVRDEIDSKWVNNIRLIDSNVTDQIYSKRLNLETQLIVSG